MTSDNVDIASIVPVAPEIVAATSDIDLVLLVDHASNHIPAVHGGLGLSAEYLDQHIAIDLGAEALARKIASLTGCGAVFARVSRLVLDVNRDPDSPTLIPEVSDGVAIPGNHALSEAERRARLDAYHTPYHAACDQVMQPFVNQGRVPLLVAVHSFTPEMNGEKRPWEVGFLYNRDARLAQALIGHLEMETDFTIGDNQPYSGAKLYYTMQRHGMAHGFPQTTLEVRQDELDRTAKVDAWAHLMADMLDACMDRPDIRFKHQF